MKYLVPVLIIFVVLGFLFLNVEAADLYPNIRYLLQDAQGNDVIRITSTSVYIAQPQATSTFSREINANAGIRLDANGLIQMGVGGDGYISGNSYSGNLTDYIEIATNSPTSTLQLFNQSTNLAAIFDISLIDVSHKTFTFPNTSGMFALVGSLGVTAVSSTRQVIAGDALSGGGTLASDVTINVVASSGLAISGDGISLNMLGITCSGTDKVSSISVTGTAICATDVQGSGTFTTTTINGLSTTTYTFATSGSQGLFINAVGGTLTFLTPTSSADTTGFLQGADWTTFNAKESALTFTAPIQRVANTVSLGFTIVSSTRTITAGSSLQGGGDLSADRTIWFGGSFATSSANQNSFTITSSTGTWTFNMPFRLNAIAALATTTGNLVSGSGNTTGWTAVTAGANGLFLMASSTQTGGIGWSKPLIVGGACTGTDKISKISVDGTITCTADETGAGGTPKINPVVIPMVMSTIWTNMPVLANEFGGAAASSSFYRTSYDFTSSTYFRLMVSNVVACQAGAKLWVMYSSSSVLGLPRIPWATLSSGNTTSSIAVGCNQTNTSSSVWGTLAPGAVRDVFLKVEGVGGNAAIDPNFTHIDIQVK